ncbi:MAG TPA: hypothetical protein VF453_08205, partial [Burkholderiaceae bacterium]
MKARSWHGASVIGSYTGLGIWPGTSRSGAGRRCGNGRARIRRELALLEARLDVPVPRATIWTTLLPTTAPP